MARIALIARRARPESTDARRLRRKYRSDRTHGSSSAGTIEPHSQRTAPSCSARRELDGRDGPPSSRVRPFPPKATPCLPANNVASASAVMAPRASSRLGPPRPCPSRSGAGAVTTVIGRRESCRWSTGGRRRAPSRTGRARPPSARCPDLVRSRASARRDEDSQHVCTRWSRGVERVRPQTEPRPPAAMEPASIERWPGRSAARRVRSGADHLTKGQPECRSVRYRWRDASDWSQMTAADPPRPRMLEATKKVAAPRGGTPPPRCCARETKLAGDRDGGHPRIERRLDVIAGSPNSGADRTPCGRRREPSTHPGLPRSRRSRYPDRSRGVGDISPGRDRSRHTPAVPATRSGRHSSRARRSCRAHPGRLESPGRSNSPQVPRRWVKTPLGSRPPGGSPEVGAVATGSEGGARRCIQHGPLLIPGATAPAPPD
jgi:hypothetical protein